MWTEFALLAVFLVTVNSLVIVDRDFPNDDEWRCCAAKQFEVGFCEIGAVRYGDHHFGYAGYSRMYYDDDSKQVAMDMHTLSKMGKGEVKFILHFNDKKMYIIYGEKGDKCKVKDITFPYKPACIRKDAKEVGSTYIGSGSAKLPIQSYYVGDKKNFEVVTTISEGCTPVGEVNYFKTSKGVTSFMDVAFWGFEEGIKDKKVFVPPSSCKSAEAYDGGEALHVKTHADSEMDKWINFALNKFTK